MIVTVISLFSDLLRSAYVRHGKFANVVGWARGRGVGPSKQASAKLAVAHIWQLHFQTLILQDSKLSGATWVTEFLLDVWTSVSVPNYQHR